MPAPLGAAALALGAPPLSLSASPAAEGLEVRFTVRPVAPLENVYVAWSLAGEGDGPCPEALRGTCLDLLMPSELVGPGPADASSTATVAHTLAGLGAAQRLWAQAVIFRLDGTIGKTPVISRPIFDAASVWLGDAAVTDEASMAALQGYSAIEGELRVEGTALTELSLPDLEQVGGDLVVWSNDALASLWLPRLRAVGALSLYDAPALDSLQGLLRLQEVGGDLSLNRLEALPHLRGLDHVERVGGRLYLFHDTALTTLDGLGALRQVGGGAQLWELYALTEARLPALEALGGRLDLFDADLLVEVSMPELSALGGYEIHHCGALASAGAFPSLRSLGDLTLRYSEGLSTFEGLSSLETLGALAVQAAPSLSSLSGLASLREIAGPLTLQGTALASLDLPALQRTGALAAENNPELLELGLPALESVTTDVLVRRNPQLSQCAVEAWLQEVTVGGGVLCGENLDDGCTAYCLADTGP